MKYPGTAIGFLLTILASTLLAGYAAAVPPEGVGTVVDLEFSDLLGSGEYRTIDPARSEGLTLLVFWSSTCAPCLREIPVINRLRSEYAASSLLIVGLPQDERPERVIAICTRFGVNWPQHVESGGAMEKPSARRLGIVRTPSYALLDAAGRVTDLGFSDPERVLRDDLDR